MKIRLLLPLLMWQTISMAQPTGVIQIPLVVHVLYNTNADSIPAELIRTIILDSVNADFRRQNLDAIYTQTAYLPIAADTEIEFRFAETDPDGNPTTGIIYKYTNQSLFNWDLNRGMMYDSLGGADPWDECHYMNVWVCNSSSLTESANQWNSQFPQGVAVSSYLFKENSFIKYYRNMTHGFGHFLAVPGFYTSSACLDTDGIDDTPIQSIFPNPTYWYVNPDTIVQELNCPEIPEGLLAGNFMMPSWAGTLNYMNMFTLGQKDRMRSFIAEHFPGFIDSEMSCFTGIEDRSESLEFAVYPNPSNGTVTISFARTSGSEVAVMLFDIAGRTVFDQRMSTVNSAELCLNLPAGIYVLKVADESSFHTEKLIIQ